MKNSNFKWFVTIAVSFLAGTLVPSAMMQSVPTPQPATGPKYLAVDYMKVDPAKVEEYLNMERELWKPMHQLRVKSGKTKSWSIYEARSPLFSPVKESEQRNYNYVTIATYDNLEDMKTPWKKEDFEKAHAGKDLSNLGGRTESARKRVGSDLFVLVEHVK